MPDTKTASPTKIIPIGQVMDVRFITSILGSNGIGACDPLFTRFSKLCTHHRRMNMLEKASVGDREQSAPSYQISRRPISRIVIPTFIAEMALSRNCSGRSKKALYSVPSFLWSLYFVFCLLEFLRAADDIIYLDLRNVAAAVVAN
jgi:hypothetical protein